MRRAQRRAACGVLAGVAWLLAGCAAGRAARPGGGGAPAALPLPPTYAWAARPGAADGLTAADTAAADAAPADAAAPNWWAGYADPRLDTLVARALAANPDLAQAAGRLAEARGALRGAGGALSPTATNTASWTRSRQAVGNFGAFTIETLTGSNAASWEVDVWGRLRADRQAAVASLAAAGYDAADLRRTVTGRVVRRYLDVAGTAERLAVTEAGVAARDTAAALVSSRARAGLAADFERERALAAADEARAQLPALRADLADALGDLAVLCGTDVATVTRLAAGARLGARVPGVPDAGVPADVLRRRPDVRAAEAQVVGAAARVRVARAALRPALSLTGSLGRQRIAGVGTFTTWSFGPSLGGPVLAPVLPFLNRGPRAQLDERRGQLLQREAAWRGAVLGAARDVETAFARAREEGARVRALAAVAGRHAEVTRLALVRWRAGTTDFRDVLDAERGRLDAERALAQGRTAFAQAVATVYQSLGGTAGVPPGAAGGR